MKLKIDVLAVAVLAMEMATPVSPDASQQLYILQAS